MTGKEKTSNKMNAEDTDIKEQNSNEQNGKKKTDFDSAWKDVIEGLFESFTEFFFPDIHKIRGGL